jgi:hypothetical protein
VTWGVLLLLLCGEWVVSVNLLSRPFGTWRFAGLYPALKRWASLKRPSGTRLEKDATGKPQNARSEGPTPNQQAGAILLRFCGMALMIAMLCAAQLLPFLQLVAHSERSASYSAHSYDWRMPIWGWANFLAPMFRLHRGNQGVYLESIQNWTTSYYAGIGTVWLGLVAMWRRPSLRIKLLGVAVLCGMVLALGDEGFLYRGLRVLAPEMGFVRYPVKFVIMIVALAPLLAACGFAALAQPHKETTVQGSCKSGFVKRAGRGLTHERLGPRWWGSTREALGSGPLTLIIVVLLCLSFLMFYSWRFRFPGEDWRLTCVNAAERGGLLLLVFAATAAFRRAQGKRQIVLGCGLLGLFWLDLVTHVPPQNPTVSPSVYAPGWAKAQLNWQSTPRLGENRVMLAPALASVFTLNTLPGVEDDYRVKRLAYFCNCNLLDDVAQMQGFFSLAPGPVSALASLPYARTNYDFRALLDFMAVNEITAPGQVYGWTARPTAMPVVTIGEEPVFADDQSVLSTFFSTNVDVRTTAFLPLEARGQIEAVREPGAKVQCEKFTNQRVLLEAHSKRPCLVEVAQSWYPAWRAYIDGQPTRIWRANYAFQALQAPAGAHQVELRYEDHAFTAGVGISLLGVLLWFGIFFRGGWPNAGSTPSEALPQ